MKYFKYLLLVLCTFTLLIGCTKKDNNLKDISYKELNEKIANNEEFFFVVTQDGCSHCEEFVPILEEVLKENNVIGYNFNLTRLSEEEHDKFKEEYNVEGTPTTIFIKDGKEVSIMQRIVGSLSKEKLEQKLKNSGYIK